MITIHSFVVLEYELFSCCFLFSFSFFDAKGGSTLKQELLILSYNNRRIVVFSLLACYLQLSANQNAHTASKHLDPESRIHIFGTMTAFSRKTRPATITAMIIRAKKEEKDAAAEKDD